jgi:hypothetical protein
MGDQLRGSTEKRLCEPMAPAPQIGSNEGRIRGRIIGKQGD